MFLGLLWEGEGCCGCGDMLTKNEISWVRGLKDKRNREEHGVFVVEGEKVVGELIGTGVLQEVYALGAWAEAWKEKLPAGVKLRVVQKEEMEKMSNLPTMARVLGVGRLVRKNFERGMLASGLSLALDGIQDSGNVGTLLRVADWFGFSRVLLSKDSADLFSQKVISASMGSFTRVPAFVVELPAVLKEAGVPVLGCDLQGKDVHEVGALKDGVVVLGSEGRGISEAVKACVTEFVTIPKFGGAESLNVGVAAGIVCDCLRRGK